MKWLTNIYDPERSDARVYHIYNTEDHDGEWYAYMEWLKDKHIGTPKASKELTAEQLQADHMVGVYVI